MQARRKRGGWGALAPPGFGQTVNPISTRGGRLYPPQYYQPPRIFRPCDGPEVTYLEIEINQEIFGANDENKITF